MLKILHLFKKNTNAATDHSYTRLFTCKDGTRVRIVGSHLFWNHAVATAYIGDSDVGTIVLTGLPGLYRIDAFRVRESVRNLGIGRALMDEMVNEMRNVKENSLIVYPHSEPYDGENNTERHLLYSIYESFGFVMDDVNADRNKLDQKMVLNIADYKYRT